MAQQRTPAAFYRGGTSKGVLFQPKDLPQDPVERDRMLLHVLGSPDPYKRQLDGMGRWVVLCFPRRSGWNARNATMPTSITPSRRSRSIHPLSTIPPIAETCHRPLLRLPWRRMSFRFPTATRLCACSTPIRTFVSIPISVSKAVSLRPRAIWRFRASRARVRRCGSSSWIPPVSPGADCCRQARRRRSSRCRATARCR